MQWNLTGLHGATWAEELINVWGPAGEICARLCRRSQLTYWSSHCNKYRENVFFNSKWLEWYYNQKECFHHFFLLAHTLIVKPKQLGWHLSVPVCSLLTKETLLVVIMTCPQFLPQLPGNMIKKDSLIGPSCPLPSSNCPPAVICCHTAKLLPWVIYSFPGWLLHHPCSHHADKQTWEIHRNGSRGLGLHRPWYIYSKWNFCCIYWGMT